MPDIAPDDIALSPPLDAWLSSLGDGDSCGPDLEYDGEFLELIASTGKPETQFGPGEAPDWTRIKDLSESLFSRTRDLRLALWWARAKVNLDGYAALPAALALVHGLLDRFWDDVHPRPDPDDPDALARLSAIGGLDKLDSLLGDIRHARLSDDRRLAGLRPRDVELALGKLPPRADESPRTPAQIAGALAETDVAAAALRTQTASAQASLQRIKSLMSQRFSSDLVVDLTTVTAMLAGIASVLPAPVEPAPGGDPETPTAGTDGASDAAEAAPRRLGGVHSVDSRQDAIRAIDLVCAYLERNEPTNPAQLLLHRASRVIDKNFLQLVQELAPDAVRDVARIMGVDPSTVEQN